MLGHTLISVEESLRDFTKLADFANFVEEPNEEVQRNASAILEKGALKALSNLLYNPPSPLLDNCRT